MSEPDSLPGPFDAANASPLIPSTASSPLRRTVSMAFPSSDDTTDDDDEKEIEVQDPTYDPSDTSFNPSEPDKKRQKMSPSSSSPPSPSSAPLRPSSWPLTKKVTSPAAPTKLAAQAQA